MTVYTVMGPAGAPSRPPYGSFAGKPAFVSALIYTVMGPGGSPSIPPYGLHHTSNPFGGKGAGTSAFFTVSGSEVKDRFPTTSVCFNYAGPFGVPSNDSRRTN